MKTLVTFLKNAVIAILLLQGSCTNDDTTQLPEDTLPANVCISSNRFTEVDYFSTEDIQSQIDVLYGNAIDWQGNNTALLFNAYYPQISKDSMAKRPAIVLFHGGAFRIGSKEQWADECIALAKKGFVAFTVNYRLGWDNSNRVDQINASYRAVQDAHAALRYIVHNAASFGVDPDWIFVGGGSAGSNTALNVVYTSQEEWNDFFLGIEASLGSIEDSGNDLDDSYDIKGVFNNWGAVIQRYVQPAEMVPMISFHGEQDTTVPIDVGSSGFVGSRAMTKDLLANGICTDLTIEPEGGHGIYLNSQGTEFRIGRASCFFKSVICSSCRDFYAEEKITASCSTSE